VRKDHHFAFSESISFITAAI